MSIVRWPISIIGKLADNRPMPIISTPLVKTSNFWYEINGDLTDNYSYLCVLFLQSLAEIKNGNNWGYFARLNLYFVSHSFYFMLDLRTAKGCVLQVIFATAYRQHFREKP